MARDVTGNLTGNRVDVAAGGSDLRLHLQGAGDTPAGEGAHSIVIIVVGAHADLGADLHGAGPVQDITVTVGDSSAVLLECLAVGIGDGGNRSGIIIAGQVQIDHAGLVVDDDHTGSTGFNSSIGLLEEGGGAAVAQGDLAFQGIAHGSKVFSGADAIDHDILLGASHGHKGLIAVTTGFSIGHVGVAHGHVQGSIAGIVHRSHAQRVGVGSGRAAGVHAHIIQIQVGYAVFGSIHIAAGVARGDDNGHAAAFQAVQNSFVLSVEGSAHTRGAGAQGQVDCVSTQQDSVLDGGHVVGVISAAVGAEDLHDQQLGIGSDTLNISSSQCGLVAVTGGNIRVGRGDTGNMGAVLTVVVRQVQIFVNIVEAEGDLGAEVQVFSVNSYPLGNIQVLQNTGDLVGIHQVQAGHILLSGHILLGSQLCQGVIEGTGIKGLMLQIQTGIDDGDTGARAGVAGGPGCGGTGLLAGGGHVGIHAAGAGNIRGILSLDDNAADAGDLLDQLDLTVHHVGRDQVGRQGQVPDHIQLGADNGLDLLDQAFLLPLQAFPVIHGRIILGKTVDGVTGIDGAGLVQEDGNTDYILIGIVCSVIQSVSRLPAGNGGRNAAVVYLRDLNVNILVSQGRNSHGSDHGDDQDHGKQALKDRRSFHTLILLFMD